MLGTEQTDDDAQSQVNQRYLQLFSFHMNSHYLDASGSFTQLLTFQSKKETELENERNKATSFYLCPWC